MDAPTTTTAGDAAVDGTTVVEGAPAVEGAPVVEGARGAAYRRRVQHDVMRGSLWTLVGSGVSLPVTFVVNLLVVHALGAGEYGRFALLTLTYSVGLAVAGGGVNDGTTQWLAAARATGDTAAADTLVRRCSGYHLLVQAPLLTGLTVWLLRDSPLPLLLAGALATAGLQALSTSAVVLIASARNALAARLVLASTLAVQTATALAATTGHVAASTWAAATVAALVGPATMYLACEPATRRAMRRPLPPLHWPVGFARYTVAAWLGTVVALLVVGRTEIFVLQWFHEPVAVALFAVAAGLAAQITVPVNSVMGPLLPAGAGLVALAPSLAVDALHRATRTSALLGAFTAGVAVPVVVLLLPTLYGATFTAAAGAMLALGVVACLGAVAGPLAAFGYATRAAPAVLRLNLAALVVDLGVTVALVPFWGLAGAVVGNAAGQTVRLALLVRVVARRLDTPGTDLVRSARTFLLGPAAALAGVGLGALLPAGGATAAVAAAVGGLAGLLLVAGVLLAVPALRLPPADGDAIAAALPGPLRRGFLAARRLLVRDRPPGVVAC